MARHDPVVLVDLVISRLCCSYHLNVLYIWNATVHSNVTCWDPLVHNIIYVVQTYFPLVITHHIIVAT